MDFLFEKVLCWETLAKMFRYYNNHTIYIQLCIKLQKNSYFSVNHHHRTTTVKAQTKML